jgi:hypothetical protein
MDAAVKRKSVWRGPSSNKRINLTCYGGLSSSGFELGLSASPL